MASNVSQLHSFQITPYPFRRIEIRGISRQPYQFNASRRLQPFLLQELPHFSTPMHTYSIPYDADIAFDPSQQLSQELHHICTVERSFFGFDHRPQLSLLTDGTSTRQVVPVGLPS